MKSVCICHVSFTVRQFRILSAVGFVSVLVMPLWLPRAHPYPASSWLQILFGSQMISSLMLAGLLWFVYLGLSSYKRPVELRRCEWLMALFWGVYAGSSLSSILGSACFI